MTPLDEVFTSTDTPFEVYMAAQRWLGILDSEGYDMRAYLVEEEALHELQNYFTLPSKHRAWKDNLRQLKFELERDDPLVYWDWWVNPESPASLILEEFKWMNGSCETPEWDRDPWTNSWPFDRLDPSSCDCHVDAEAMDRIWMRHERW